MHTFARSREAHIKVCAISSRSPLPKVPNVCTALFVKKPCSQMRTRPQRCCMQSKAHFGRKNPVLQKNPIVAKELYINVFTQK